MGYRIEYSNSSPKRENKRKSGRKWIAALLVVVLIICVQQYWPQGTRILQGILFPVDMDDVQSGWTCFVQQLQSGGGIRDALMVFCREILAGAEIA